MSSPGGGPKKPESSGNLPSLPGVDWFAGDTTWVPTDPGREERLELVIVGRNAFVRHPLPSHGILEIGRGGGVDVRVDDASISRRHARLHVTGVGGLDTMRLRIEDLGSSNGTRLNGMPLRASEERPFRLGESVELGMTTMIIQASVSDQRPRRLWTHGYFAVRVEEECARAARSQSAFGVVRLLAGDTKAAALVEAQLTSCLRAFDVVSTYAPGEYEVLLIDAGDNDTGRWLAALERCLADSGVAIKSGSAIFPRDGRTPDELIASAGKGLRGLVTADAPADASFIEDVALRRLGDVIERVAPSDIAVLILGETGVGKELIAEQIHRRSGRAKKPFLRLNCAALSQTLLESELFGHERGAFTGAVAAKPGLLETAAGGTVLLDEVGDLPEPTQAKLLRVIEQRQVYRVGSVRPQSIDVRVISATNRDLDAAIESGRFRNDLYYRLSGVTLMVPPLRDRVDGLDALVGSFAVRARQRAGLAGAQTFTEPAMRVLRQYTWPGNIRELRNVIERAVLLARSAPIDVEHLPMEKLAATVLTGAPVPLNPPSLPSDGPLAPSARLPTEPAARRASWAFDANETLDPVEIHALGSQVGADLKTELEAVERQRIVEALEECAGNQTQAAKHLGISRRTLLYRLDLYNIPRPRKSRSPR